MKITPSQAVRWERAVDNVLDLALVNSCSCAGAGDGSGYLGHDRGCHVHLHRHDLRLVAGLIQKLALLSRKGGGA